jgi:hypothetical protein
LGGWSSLPHNFIYDDEDAPLKSNLDGAPSVWVRNLLFERSHINHEAVFHVTLGQAVIGLVDVLNLDQFNVGSDAVVGAEPPGRVRVRPRVARAGKARDPQAEAFINDLFRRHKEGRLPLNDEGRRAVLEMFEPLKVRDGIIEGLRRIAEQRWTRRPGWAGRRIALATLKSLRVISRADRAWNTADRGRDEA